MTGLVAIDYIVIAAYLAAIMMIAVYFSRKQVSTEVYFVGGRSIPWWAMGLSMMATLISSITFIAYPGDAYEKNWSGLVPGLMVPVVLLLMAAIIVPFYRQAVRMSAYEYFEQRFGYGARLYSSLSFIVIHFTKMAFVFWLVSLAISSMTEWDIYLVIAILGAITVVYTLLGGIEAVIWSDVIQGSVLAASAVVCAVVVLMLPEEGPGAALAYAWDHGKFSLGSFQLNLYEPTFVVLAFYGLSVYIQKYAADQTIVQRYLVAKSSRDALKGTILGSLLCVPIWALFLFIGSLVWSYYQLSGHVLPASIDRADEVFPYFIMHELPAGISGLILAALISAAMSTLDSDLNCLSVVIVEDYYRRVYPAATDSVQMRVGRWAVVAAGAASVGLATWLASSGGTALSLAFSIAAIVSGGATGLFGLAFLCRRANKQGVYVGIVASILFTAWATLTNKGKLDLGDFVYTLHPYLIGVFANIVLFVVGYAVSLAFPHRESSTSLTVWGWLGDGQAKRSEKSPSTGPIKTVAAE